MFKDFSSKYHRILITGGAGFIGSNLISKLLENTDCKIFNIDKMGYASDETNINNSLTEFTDFLKFSLSSSFRSSSTIFSTPFDLFASQIIIEVIKAIRSVIKL